MKPAESTQIEFIKDCLRKGEKRKAILAKFSKKWQKVAIRTFDTRLKAATTAMEAEMKLIIAKSDEGVAKEVEARQLKILSRAEKMDILSRIALGEIPLQKPMVCDGIIHMIDVVPDYMDRKNAITELNKMEGDHSPTKAEVVVTDKIVVKRPTRE